MQVANHQTHFLIALTHLPNSGTPIGHSSTHFLKRPFISTQEIVHRQFNMGNRRIQWHAYVTEQVITSVNQIKRMNNLQRMYVCIYYELLSMNRCIKYHISCICLASHNMLCPILFISNTIELTVHTSCYCIELTSSYQCQFPYNANMVHTPFIFKTRNKKHL